MEFYKAFKMKTDSTSEGGFRFSLCSVECYEENGELVDVEVGYNGDGVDSEDLKRDGIELEVYATAKRCLEHATVCGYPYFYKVMVPADAVIEENAEHGYTVAKELRFVRELSFDDMMAIAAKEEHSGAACESGSKCGDTERANVRDLSYDAVMESARELGRLIKEECGLWKREEALEQEKASAGERERRQFEYTKRVERENSRLRFEAMERRRAFPLWLGSAAVIGMVVGYFIGLIVGIII